ncbi:hypothetical protein L3Q82_016293 [Scortum barcoo]|uniref:Uncharacterized protein n=1 Tax=Scortum barcoo TaxID=214431 RepID=A0ACB8VTQ6_9TELE|nr:hypothetical protein L3Q82_016293 [Scortum barcoo]
MRFSSWPWNSGPALYSTGCWRVYGSLPNQSTCFCGSEKALTVSSWYSGECSCVGSEAFGAGGLCTTEQCLHCQRFLGEQGAEGVWFGNHRISSLLFADDVVLLVSLSQDLQHVLGGLQPSVKRLDENQHLQIRGHGSRPEKGGVPLRVGESCLKWRSLLSRGLVHGEGKMEREIDRRIGAAPASYAVGGTDRSVKKELSLAGKLSIYRSPYVPPHLWLMNLGNDQRMRSRIQAAEMKFPP